MKILRSVSYLMSFSYITSFALGRAIYKCYACPGSHTHGREGGRMGGKVEGWEELGGEARRELDMRREG